MRASPRTCPSIRCRRLSAEVLASLFIPAILPLPGMGFKRQAIAMMTDISPKASHGENPPNGAHAAPCCHNGAAAAETVKDPVCGMNVDPHKTPHRHIHHGRPYYFCSAGCRNKFAADPEKYQASAAAPAPASPPVPAGTIYTCPMHPEIRQVGPGSCPICGIALEPEIATADAGPNPELVDMTRRFWIALALSVPIFVLATPVVLWAGWPFFERGWQSLVTRNLNMFTLIAMGTGVAYVYSVVATLAPQIFPATFRG